MHNKSRPSINNRALYIQSSIGDHKNINKLGDYSESIYNKRSDFYNKIGNTKDIIFFSSFRSRCFLISFVLEINLIIFLFKFFDH